MSTFLTKINPDRRPKAFITSNKMTKQIIFNTSALLPNNNILGMNSYVSYVEFDKDTTDVSGLETAILTALASNGIDTTNIQLQSSAYNTDGDGIKITYYIKNETTLDEITLQETKIEIKRISNLIINGFTVDFDNNGELVTANIVGALTTDNEHAGVYHFNTYYSFDASGNNDIFGNNIIKLLKHGNLTTNSAIRSGNHVYMQDISGLWLQKNTSVLTPFTFDSNESNKQLLEVRGYHNFFLSEIPEGNTIPLDYGFKLEVLPPFVEGLDLGLDTSGFTFSTDGLFCNIGVDPDDFTADIYNFIETGDTSGYEHLITDTSDVAPDNYKCYNIDERFVLFDISGSSLWWFTYDNDDIKTEVFYNGTKLCL